MQIHTYKNIEFSEIMLQELSNDLRIDADFYQPTYLRTIDAVITAGSKPLGSLQTEIIHPTEIKRIYSDEGVQILLAQNIRDNVLDFNTTVFMPESTRKPLSRNKLVTNDVVMTRSGANYGQTAYYLDDPVELFACADCLVIRTNRLNGLYLSTYLNCSYGKLLVDRGSYGMAQPHIAPSYLYKLPIPMPSVRFQKHLEKLINLSFQKKQLADKLYADAESLLLKELGLLDWKPDTAKFTLGGREFEVESSISKINCSEMMSVLRMDAEFFSPYAHYILSRIYDYGSLELRSNADVVSGYAWKSIYFLEPHEEGEPFVRIRDCKPGVIDCDQLNKLDTDYATKQNQHKAQKGDLLIGMDGLKWFYAGLVESPCYVNQRVAWVQPRSASQFSAEYLLLVINCIVGQTQLLRDMTIADTVGHITNKNVRNLLIPNVSSQLHKKISKQIQTSHVARNTSRQLLNQAKHAVELFIEEGEEAALKLLEPLYDRERNHQTGRVSGERDSQNNP